ncbi:hypothetical protein [Sphingobacterium siyangense]|uniref:hypothetical protein n=1 Tax=Sphingobacterium siyangense TaxID=459529 RepID=UPI003DA26AF5
MDTQISNAGHGSQLFTVLFELCDVVNEMGMGTFKLRTAAGFKEVSFKGAHYTVHTFLESLDRGRRERYSTYLSQAPLLHSNPYFKYNSSEVSGFGHSYECGAVAVSINNPDNWMENFYIIEREYLGEGTDAEIVTEEKRIHHLPNKDALDMVSKAIADAVLLEKVLNLDSIASIRDLWERKEELFDKLEFSMETEVLLYRYESINEPNFIKAVNYLSCLNVHLYEVSLGRKSFGDLPGSVSNDGQATLNKYGDERIFTLNSGDKVKFSLHVKLGGNLRIYLWPEENRGKITVGHVGHHLRTVKYSK